MTPERWQQIADLAEKALELEPEKRARFLDEACSADSELLHEVHALIDSGNDMPSNFLQSEPLSEGLLANLHETVTTGPLQAGQHFGKYQLIRKLGEGGMGQVWLAEQTAPVRRQVALKLIRAGMYDELVVQRFQLEQQSLAIMDHPSIAKVFEAGTTQQGQPYFVMEYVPGQPITEYCDDKKLKIKDRLELFIQACEGVQHAHQKAIIHRDLKPANILVVEVDGKPVPRIIDFGLAKATTARTNGNETFFTQIGHFVGTPGYMSPEQADPNVKDIDTRTDVYSLGVVLYVLLAGSRPLDEEELPLDELLRRLREEEPPKPSARVSSDRQTSSSAAEARGTELKALVNQLRGDLDWITMKAIEKDRTRRYGTPSELAADIRRYLNHQPVIARPASTAYRLRKYVRRHRLAVGALAGVVLLLAAFSILQAVQLRRITRERDRANRITDFMTAMFKVSDPGQSRGNSVTAREILDKASTDVEKGLARDPEVQSEMMQVMSSTYLNLGLYTRAHELAKRALDSRLRLLGENDTKTLESMAQLGWTIDREGHYDDAEKIVRQALAAERRKLGAGNPLTLETIDHLAVIVKDEGRHGEAEKLDREALEVGSRTMGLDNPLMLRSMNNLAVDVWNQGRYPEAEQLYRQLIDLERRDLGPDHPETLKAMSNLALTLESEGRRTEAESLYREVLASEDRVLGHDHPVTANALENLATVVTVEGHLAEGEQLHREAVAIQTRVLGPDHDDTLLSKLNLADVLLKEGHTQGAEKLQRETLASQMRVLGPENPDTLLSQSDLVRTLNKERRYEESEKLARRTLEAQQRILGPQHPDTLVTLQSLESALAASDRYAEATQLFRDSVRRQESSPPQGDPWFIWYNFACVATAAKRPDDALQYLREAINRGYKDGDSMMADDDLKSLRHNAKFLQLVAEIKRSPATTQASKE